MLKPKLIYLLSGLLNQKWPFINVLLVHSKNLLELPVDLNGFFFYRNWCWRHLANVRENVFWVLSGIWLWHYPSSVGLQCPWILTSKRLLFLSPKNHQQQCWESDAHNTVCSLFHTLHVLYF